MYTASHRVNLFLARLYWLVRTVHAVASFIPLWLVTIYWIYYYLLIYSEMIKSRREYSWMASKTQSTTCPLWYYMHKNETSRSYAEEELQPCDVEAVVRFYPRQSGLECTETLPNPLTWQRTLVLLLSRLRSSHCHFPLHYNCLPRSFAFPMDVYYPAPSPCLYSSKVFLKYNFPLSFIHGFWYRKGYLHSKH